MNEDREFDFQDWVLNCVGIHTLITTQPMNALRAAFEAGVLAEREAYAERANGDRENG